MEMEQDKQTESPRQGAIGPGERLQAARIKMGLSIEDIANRMHLSNSILQSIEENNFDEITAPIFVKGYLRAYARIVALNEDEMIKQYLELYSEDDPPISSTSNMVPELSSTDTRIKWATYLVIIVLAVLLAAWWWNKQQNQQPPVSLDVPSSTVAENNAGEAVVGSGIEAGSEAISATVTSAAQAPQPKNDTTKATAAPAPAVSVAAEPVATQTTGAQVIAREDTAAVAVAQAVDASASGPAIEPLETAAPESGDSTTASAALALAETQTALAGTREFPGRSAPTGNDKLRIIVHADTWADAKDSSNYQLLYDLLRADSSAVLSGQAPFTVFLGNGHGVEIFFNGEEIGFSAKIRSDNTVRLNIGG